MVLWTGANEASFFALILHMQISILPIKNSYHAVDLPIACFSKPPNSMAPIQQECIPSKFTS